MTNFTNPSTQTSGHLVTAEEWNEFVNNFKFFDETRCIPIPMADTHSPPNTQAAGIEYVSGAGTPAVAWHQRLFDGTTVEGWQFGHPVPDEYKDSPAFVFLGHMATATGGTIVLNAYVSYEGAGVNGTAPTFDTVNAGTFVVPGTAATTFFGTISLTNNDSMAAGGFMTLHVQRNPADAQDGAGGDFVMKKGKIDYGI